MKSLLSLPLTFLIAAGCASSQTLTGPSHTPIAGCYQDYAQGLSDSTGNAVNRLCESLQKQSGLKLAVVTVPSLAGLSDEAYADALAAPWQKMDPMAHDCVIVLLSFYDRRIRITLFHKARKMSDAQAKQIIETDFIPHFKRGQKDVGTVAGVTSIVNWFAKH